MMAIHLVEVKDLNQVGRKVERQIDMIILLQRVVTEFTCLFLTYSALQSASSITKADKLNYKVFQALQSEM